jgi:hypothetical protein
LPQKLENQILYGFSYKYVSHFIAFLSDNGPNVFSKFNWKMAIPMKKIIGINLLSEIF